ncbi:MAG: ABC transporter ATP-binding protein [Pseudomonadota bacterium]
MPVLNFDAVTFGYDDIPAIRDFTTKVFDGTLTAIVGPNGAGKSTLLRGIGGELTPLTGQIDRKHKDIAYLPQQAAIDRSFPISVYDFVAMGLWHRFGAFGGMNAQSRADLARAIDAVGLTGLDHRSIGQLSGGQFQRALFARLLLQDARLVLLDEPFTSIDAKTTADLLRIVKQWHGDGRTVIAVLHDYDLVREHFPDTMMVARDLVAHGATADVMTSENLMRARQMCEACDTPPDHTCGKAIGYAA